MKFSAFALLFSTVSALDVNLEGSISTGSSLGKKILANARALNDNNNNGQYTSWMQNYSIKFDGCVQVPRFEREEGFRSDLLAKFKLCPSDSCGNCWNGGEYVVDMKELIESYQEAKQMENEQACENAVQSCEYQCQNGYYEYNGDDDEACQYSCLSAQSMSYCMQDDNQEQQMDDIGECRAINEQGGQNGNNGNNNYNSNYEMYYVGAYCTSKGVFAGTFKDSACTKHAPSGTYEKYNYGASLPTEALVPSGCIANCDASVYENDDNQNNNNNGNNNGNNNDNNQNAVSDVCENLYEQSAKCEKNIDGNMYPDTSGCELINEMLPRANNAFAQMQGKKSAAAIWAWIFGIACVCMGAYIFLLHKRVIRERVDMNKLGLV
ncbi:MAG: hypothetical protein SGBAC_001888 [Bacillariaceae sp.]